MSIVLLSNVLQSFCRLLRIQNPASSIQHPMKQHFDNGRIPIPQNTTGAVNAFIMAELAPLFGAEESRAMSLVLFEHYAGIGRRELLTGRETRINQSELIRIYNAVLRLKAHEPLQYITGETEFYGLKFSVNPSVLIPRPETEELVEMILAENRGRPSLTVLDVGTGSGCIPVSLARHLRDAHVYACDISAEALQTAKQNAERNEAVIVFLRADFLQPGNWDQFPPVDILVSNPPYIKRSEERTMAAHVLQHEPSQALFVPDEDALVFYRAIARFGREKLNPGGKVYVEINEALGNETAGEFLRGGYNDAEVLKDLSGKDRFVRAFRP